MAEEFTVGKYLEAIAADEELFDEYEARLMASGDDYEQAVKQSVREALDALLTDSDGRVRPVGENRRILNEIASAAEEIFADAGLQDAVDDVLDIYDARLDTMDDIMRQAGLEAAVVGNFQEFEAIQDEIDFVVRSTTQATGTTADLLRETIFRVRDGLDSQDWDIGTLKEMLEKRAGILPRYTKTTARTQLGAIDRKARMLQADRANIQDMKYMGVLDGLTRTFCRDNLDRVESIEYWRNAHNDTGPQPVARYCGGYNCRHRLMPWRREWDEE